MKFPNHVFEPKIDAPGLLDDIAEDIKATAGNTKDTVAELTALNNTVAELTSDLESERQERKSEDAEIRAETTKRYEEQKTVIAKNHADTVKQNAKSNRIAVVAVIIAVLALLFTIYTFFAPLWGFWHPRVEVYRDGDRQGYSSEYHPNECGDLLF